MSNELDAIVQRIAVEGTGEAGAALQELAEIGKSAFERISEAAEGGAGGLKLFGAGALVVTAALAAAAYATYEFAKSSSEAVIKLDSIGHALGETAGSVEGLEDAFAKYGMSSQSVERMLERGALNLARQWSHIVSDAEQGGNRIASATTAIAAAHLRVEEAMNNARNSSTEWAQKLQSDALSVAEAFNKVQNSSAEAASETQHDASSVAGAEFALEDAEAKNRELHGWGKEDAGTKARREMDKSDQAVADAQQRVIDARNKQMQDAINAPLKAQREQLGLAQAQFGQTKDQQQAALAPEKTAIEVQKAGQDVKNAIFALATAQHNDLDLILKSIQSQNVAELIRSGPENFVKATTLAAGRDAAAAGRPMPEFTDLLVKAQEMFTQLGNKMPDNFVQAVTQSLTHLRPGTDVALMSKALNDPQFDIRKEMAAHKDDIPQSRVDAAYKNVGAAAEAEAKIKHTADTVGVALGETLRNGANDAATALRSLADAATKLAAPKSEGNSLNDVVRDMSQQPMAGGGDVRGPGNSTSDSIPARLSNGEFVVRAAAVRAYGSDMLHAINDMTARGFSLGGYVSSFRPAHFSEGGFAGGRGPESAVHLHLDGQSFQMRAAANVAHELQHFAISRQMASTGRKPSWVR